MNEYYHYCQTCLYRISEEDFNNKEVHAKKFGCNDLKIKLQYNDFKNDFWIQGIFEQLDEAENYLILHSKEEKNLTIDDYDPNLEDKYLLVDRHPRIAFILIDNVTELILYSKIFFSSLTDNIEQSNYTKIERYYNEKVKFIFSKNLISEKEKDLLITFHEIRNKLYHIFIPEKFLFLRLANTYLLFCRDIFLKLFQIVYPIKYKKINKLDFEENAIFEFLLILLEDELETLKANLAVQERDIYSSKKDNIAKNFKDFKEYLLNLISFEINEFDDLLKCYSKLKEESENKNVKIKVKIENLFKRLVEIVEINQILHYDITEYYAYLDYLGNIR